MSNAVTAPLIVISSRQEHSVGVNSALRNTGRAVHCSWISDPKDLSKLIGDVDPDLIVYFTSDASAKLDAVVELRDEHRRTLPLVVVLPSVDEDIIADLMRRGAQDAVSSKHAARLQSVLIRELDSSRRDRGLSEARLAARTYHNQLKTFVDRSADASALVQEGILVEVNPAWMTLFRYAEPDALIGQPILDIFEERSYAALKGAMTACMRGKWSGHTMRSAGTRSDKSTIALDLDFDSADFEGEPCVRIRVSRVEMGEKTLKIRIADITKRDATTAFYERGFFFEALDRRLREPCRGGLRALAYIKPDRLSLIAEVIGPLVRDDVLAEIASLFKDFIHPKDLCGRIGDDTLGIFIARGTQRDVEKWAENLRLCIANHVFEIGQHSISISCTIGNVIVESSEDDAASLLTKARKAYKTGDDNGGNQVCFFESDGKNAASEAYDETWVRHIKNALLKNRFRLERQSIAGLQAETQGMHDVLLRMIDEAGNDVLPSEFIPAAERNDLMRPIDRWVIGSALSLCGAEKLSCVFLRLSKDSLTDDSLPAWLVDRVRKAGIDPHRLCFQVTEENANRFLKQTKVLASRLRDLGFNFAIEHLGTGPNPAQILGHVPMDFAKIDGSLMQGLTASQSLQEQVRRLVNAAKSKNIQTIAERIEDANTMAVLWQLGLDFMQGHFLQEQEEVVMADVTQVTPATS